MELRDLVVTPIVIMLVYLVAYLTRPRVTDEVTRKYFFPALTLKIFGALAVGFIYQFYYGGGDTFNFHSRGSRVVWNAFVDSPLVGIKLLFADGTYSGDTFEYANHIPFYHDASSYFVVRVASVFDIITFSSYSATAVLFATLSFVGVWLLFKAFYDMYPQLHRWIAVACFFIPSVFFWGSGLLKDTLTLAALGVIVYTIKMIFIDGRISTMAVVSALFGIWVIFIVKKYILLCFLPAVLLWIYSERLFRIKSLVIRVMLVPVVITAIVYSGYYAVQKLGEGDQRYSIDQLAKTAQITAYDIGFYTGRDAGSGYSLGELDGSFGSMIKLAPAAINVALFRPYLWEVNNPLMLLSSIESLVFLCLVVVTLYKRGRLFFSAWLKPSALFCLVFSLVFAFAVGVSTFNFGTLARYKIPMIPFFVIGIALTYNSRKQGDEQEKLSLI